MEKIENYDFSEDSEEEVEKLEKDVLTDIRTNGKINNIPNDDTEYDSDLSNVAKRFDSESVFDSNHTETLRRLKKFFGKNRKKLKGQKQTNSALSIQGNFYSDSLNTNETNLLNKKRNKN